MRVVPNYVLIYNLIPFPEQALLQFDCAFPKFLMERVCLLYDTFRFFFAYKHPAVMHFTQSVQQRAFCQIMPIFFKMFPHDLGDDYGCQANEHMNPNLIVRPVVLWTDTKVVNVL